MTYILEEGEILRINKNTAYLVSRVSENPKNPQLVLTPLQGGEDIVIGKKGALLQTGPLKHGIISWDDNVCDQFTYSPENKNRHFSCEITDESKELLQVSRLIQKINQHTDAICDLQTLRRPNEELENSLLSEEGMSSTHALPAYQILLESYSLSKKALFHKETYNALTSLSQTFESFANNEWDPDLIKSQEYLETLKKTGTVSIVSGYATHHTMSKLYREDGTYFYSVYNAGAESTTVDGNKSVGKETFRLKVDESNLLDFISLIVEKCNTSREEIKEFNKKIEKCILISHFNFKTDVVPEQQHSNCIAMSTELFLKDELKDHNLTRGNRKSVYEDFCTYASRDINTILRDLEKLKTALSTKLLKPSPAKETWEERHRSSQQAYHRG